MTAWGRLETKHLPAAFVCNEATGVVAACEVLKRVRNGGNTAVNGHPRGSNTVVIYAYYRPQPDNLFSCGV